MVLSESLTCGLICNASGTSNESYGSLVVVKKIKRGEESAGLPRIV
jgi:hypothetical protein